MEKLAHLATFVSLIYGLGVANVLAQLASLIKRGRNADWYWIHTLWTVHLLLLMAGFWWLLQSWARMPQIGFFSYLSMLVVPALLFVASDLLFPERSAEGAVDLRAHFFRIKRPFFWAILGVLLADQLDSLQKGWQHVLALGPYYWGTQAYWLLACLLGMRSQSERVQGFLVSLSLLLFVGGMINALAYV